MPESFKISFEVHLSILKLKDNIIQKVNKFLNCLYFNRDRRTKLGLVQKSVLRSSEIF